MKTELCHFSGFKIYPGHGKRVVRTDCKSFVFINNKVEQHFWKKNNPRKVPWTQAYRRVHKKGTQQEIQKRKTRRVIKIQRDIVGASLDQIRQKKGQKAEIRAASREAALKEIKERKAKRQAAGKKAGGKVQAAKGAAAPKNVKAAKPAGKGR